MAQVSQIIVLLILLVIMTAQDQESDKKIAQLEFQIEQLGQVPVTKEEVK